MSLTTFSRLALLLLAAVPHSNSASTRLASLQADPSLFSAISFDYIIIGGGTAGITLATRLTEDAHVHVGIIEAGLYHQQEPVIDMPARFGQGIGTDVDWGYLSTPQAAANNGILSMASGKMVGGSSGLNFEAWTRASKSDYDAWESLGNGPTWNWDSLLPYFKKTETYIAPPPQGIFPGATLPTSEDISMFHGSKGPLKPSFNDLYGSIVAPSVKALNQLGISTNSDPSNGNGTGIFNLQRSVDKDRGVRSYAANTYFSLSGNRPNLHVLTGASASKIVFDKSTRNGKVVASGVQYTFGGQAFTAHAAKEVILSAGKHGYKDWKNTINISRMRAQGTVQTPKILELSGIGNKTLLDRLGIETIVDLPQVGENLQDQPIVNRDFLLHPDMLGIDQLRNNVTFALEQLKIYERANDGYYAATVPAVAFVPISDVILQNRNEAIDRLERRLLSELSNSTSTLLYSAQLKIQLQWLRSKDVAHVEFIFIAGGGMTSTPPAANSSYLTMTICLLHPFSRGNIHINTTDPLEHPLINPNFLNLPIDVESFVYAGSFTEELVKTQPLAASVVNANNPPPGVDFLNFTRAFLGSVHHPIGTAALAPQELGGVVDPALMVYGTANIRVVDASIIPLQIATHPQATVYAIAEKAADIIKGIKY